MSGSRVSQSLCFFINLDYPVCSNILNRLRRKRFSKGLFIFLMCSFHARPSFAISATFVPSILIPQLRTFLEHERVLCRYICRAANDEIRRFHFSLYHVSLYASALHVFLSPFFLLNFIILQQDSKATNDTRAREILMLKTHSLMKPR